MTVYRYIRDSETNGNRADMVLKISDGFVATIPNDTNNADWIEYRAWRCANPANVPLEAW